MRLQLRAALFGGALLLCSPAAVRAGMPSVDLTDVASMRVQTISFFLAGLLLSAFFVKLIWNRLRQDFTSLPRLNYRKALAVVVLWGLLFVLVLVMISGARELMTPGAWEKRGITYHLAGEPDAPPADTQTDLQRRQKLGALWVALSEYAQAHEGRFPDSSTTGGISEDLWRAGEKPGMRYMFVVRPTADYVVLPTAGKVPAPLVFEPVIYGDRRLVLLTDGSIRFATPNEIRQALPREGR